MRASKGNTVWLIIDGAVVQGVVTHASSVSANVRVGDVLHRGRRLDYVFDSQERAELAVLTEKAYGAAFRLENAEYGLKGAVGDVLRRREELRRAEDRAADLVAKEEEARAALAAALNAVAARQFGEGATVVPTTQEDEGAVRLRPPGLVSAGKGGGGVVYRVVRP